MPVSPVPALNENYIGTMDQSNPWVPYIGDCKALDTYLNSKSGILWVLPKYLNALFRGIAQVVFANNPLTGLVILVALTWNDLVVGIATIVAATVAIITALLMRQDWGAIQAGLTTYNSVLVGCVTASLWTPLYDEPLSPKLWGFIVLGSMLSVFINSGIANILSKWSLPSLTLPFNVVILLLFTCLMPPITPDSDPSSSLALSPVDQSTTTALGLAHLRSNNFNYSAVIDSNYSETGTDGTDAIGVRDFTWDDDNKELEKKVPVPENLKWGEIWSGIILSMGQVFAIETVMGSILIYIAIMIYSPLLCLMCVIGAFLGTLSGIIFTPEAPYTAIYAGLWGYNAILSAAAAGGFFFVMTFHSFLTALANVIFTVLLQQGLVIAFRELRLPVFTLPFVLSTFLFLSVTATGSHLIRVTNISFPEMHRYEFIERRRLTRQNRKEKQSIDIDEESGGDPEAEASTLESSSGIKNLHNDRVIQ